MEAIAEVFNEVQESTSISQKQVYALLEQYESNKTLFIRAVEQCYLKIIKNMLKAPRKVIEKYEKLTEKLFETGYRQYALREGACPAEGKKQKLTKKDIFQLFQHFLSFFSAALDSTQLQIRIFSSRIVFQLLKILPSEVLQDVIETKVAKQIILGTLSLMKEKKGNLKQIGIKITSYLQRLMERSDLIESQEAKTLKTEMMRSMCMEEQDQIRKLALINLEMNENNFPHLIKRIRDKNPEIRATVFKKLIKEQIPLANLNLSDVYKLIYDGLGSREISVRDACTRYLSLNYCLFKDEPEKGDQNGEEVQMDIEDKIEEGEERVSMSGKKASSKRHFQANKEAGLKEMKINIVNFLSTFEVEKSLYYPELYESLEALVKETVKSILGADSFAIYLKEVFLTQLCLKKKRKHTKIDLTCEEMLLIRIVCQMAQNQEDRKELSPEIVAVIEDCFPNGAEFSQVIEYYAYTAPSLFSLYQSLLTSELLINCDEAGRNKLEETLKNLVNNMNNQQLGSEIPVDEAGEYNDIFYELDAERVKNSIFALAYFSPPIITCAFELLPIIIRILKNVVSDDRANVQLIQLISEVHEPLAKDADNDSHFDLPSELERIHKIVKDGEAKYEIIEKELALIKKNKTKQKEIYELEKEKEMANTRLLMLKEKEEQIQLKIFDVSMRQLILVQALLTNCKIDPQDPAISHLLQQVIVPGLKSENENLVAHALKALALYVLVDKNVCNDFFTVFQDLLSKNEDCANSTPQEIISLRAIVDFILLYDLSNQANPEEEEIDIVFTQDLVMKYAYQADTLLRTIAIEGLSKLLFNGKLQDPQSTICLLMVIWFDTKICQREGFKAIQILSTLFKTYTASSYSNLTTFEKGLELFTLLIITLEKKGLVFNDNFVLFDHLNEKFTSKALRVGINLLSYEYHKTTDALNNRPPADLPPQEKFFVYLAYKSTKDKRYLALFEKVTQFFDFYNSCQPEHYHILLHFLTEILQNCPMSKQLIAIDKLLKEKIKLAFQNEKIEEGVPQQQISVIPQQSSEEADAKLFELSQKQKYFCERIVNHIESNSNDMEVIIRNFSDSSILVQDTQEQKDKRAKVNDEEEEDEAEEIAVQEEEEQENTKLAKQRGNKGGKRKVPHTNEEDEPTENEIKREAPKRGKRAKDIEEVASEEEEHGNEAVQETIQKRTSSRRTQKLVEEKIFQKKIKKEERDELEEDEQERISEEDEEEIVQEEKQKRIRGFKQILHQNPQKGKRGKKAQPQEDEEEDEVQHLTQIVVKQVEESDDEVQEEEEIPEEQPQRQIRKGKKAPSSSNQNTKNSRSRRHKQEQESDAEEAEDENEEGEEENIPPVAKKSQKELKNQSQNIKKVNEKKKNVKGKQIEVNESDDEEQEEEEENEEDQEVVAPQVKGRGRPTSQNQRGRTNKNIQLKEEEEQEIAAPRRTSRKQIQESPPQKQVSTLRRSRR